MSAPHKLGGGVRLIVVADDLGLSGSVDRGIVEAHRAGPVSHASWLAGGESADAAVDLVRESAPGLGIGLVATTEGLYRPDLLERFHRLAVRCHDVASWALVRAANVPTSCPRQAERVPRRPPGSSER